MIKVFNRILLISSFLFLQVIFSQKIDDDKTIEKINTSIKDFFISKGEIDNKNKLGIGAWEITDGSEIGYKEIGIYLIRTVYRTDGTDYLLLKNGENFEIVDFNDLKNVITKSTILLNNKTEEDYHLYISKILKCYDENYAFSKKKTLRFEKK